MNFWYVNYRPILGANSSLEPVNVITTNQKLEYRCPKISRVMFNLSDGNLGGRVVLGF